MTEEFWPSRGRARFGVVVPMSNVNLEPDMAMLRPEGVSLHIMRAGGYDLDQVPDGEQMRGFALASLDEVIAALAAARPDIILYGCTSATLAHGPDFDRSFAEEITAKSGVPAVTAAGAVVEALKALGATRIGFSSPYVQALNQDCIAFLEQSGLTVVSSAYVGEDLGNYGQGELTPERVRDLGRQADCDAGEAVLLSCTDMRAVETITALEVELGKPVVTSNQALIWAAMRRLGIPPDAETGGGRLFAITA